MVLFLLAWYNGIIPSFLIKWYYSFFSDKMVLFFLVWYNGIILSCLIQWYYSFLYDTRVLFFLVCYDTMVLFFPIWYIFLVVVWILLATLCRISHMSHDIGAWSLLLGYIFISQNIERLRWKSEMSEYLIHHFNILYWNI